jgi:alpha-glucosidase
MQLSAFHPFYRNHNILGAIPQEPYRWDSVAEASRVAIAARYALLPYWYTLFYNSANNGTSPMRALFFEFPNEPELFGIDRQFMVGRDILVTPVLAPGATTVDGIFPGRGSVIWRDWFTHDVVKTNSGKNTTLQAPLGHINVHIRSGSAMLLHAKPSYTTTESRGAPYSMLVSLGSDGKADGSAYIDDGESVLPTPSRKLAFKVDGSKLTIGSEGDFKVDQKLDEIVILGVQKPRSFTVNGADKKFDYEDGKKKLVVKGCGLDLNRAVEVTWKH